MEVGGVQMEGTLRFLGEVEGKDGQWAGVELAQEWTGKGKNDGSVRGTQYFACPPLCGLFLPLSKISLLVPRPPPALAPRTAPSKLLSSSRRGSRIPIDATSQTPHVDGPPDAEEVPREFDDDDAESGETTFCTARPTRYELVWEEHDAVAGSFGKGDAVDAVGGQATLGDDASRPTTPSVRSYSRQSFASVSSRSAAGSVNGHNNSSALAAELEESREREREARTREAEVRRLLEASERVGREMESAMDRTAKDAGEVKRRDKLKDSDDDRVDLEAQISQLRLAGQALCETYEERISAIELLRLEAEERLLEIELVASPPSSTSLLPSSAHELGQSTNSDADLINAETARAEVEHLRTKVEHLEEQLEETRQHLEAEMSDTKRRRTRTGEVETMLKKEVKGLREALEKSAKDSQRFTSRILELEDALLESQTALESERSELEHFRLSTDPSSPSSSSSPDHDSLHALQLQLSRSTELVTSLREDLRQAEKEIDRFHRLSTPVPSVQPTQDTPNLSPSGGRKRDSIASSVSSRKSLGGSAGAGGKDDRNAMKEQIVGLKVLLQATKEENAELGERNKVLMTESQELRDAQRALESTVENLMNEMSSGGAGPTPAVAAARVSSQRLSTAPLQREVDSLKSQLKDAEKKYERETKALNQEVNELESLVESKTYREDELELELEQLKRYGNQHHSNASNGTGASHSRNGSAALDEGECEMCGEKGHDLDSCPDFGGGLSSARSASMNKMAAEATANGTEFCDDCAEYGHSLEECPLANEMF
ncbi:hypothetical protein RQP46_010125 [Phenoliferia psychrophenolica]